MAPSASSNLIYMQISASGRAAVADGGCRMKTPVILPVSEMLFALKDPNPVHRPSQSTQMDQTARKQPEDRLMVSNKFTSAGNPLSTVQV